MLCRPRGHITSVNLLGGTGQSCLTQAHVQCEGREPELYPSGKYLVHTMYDLQFYTDLFLLWVYPFAEFKRYHTRLIESDVFRKRASSEPGLGLVLLLQLLTLISVAYAHTSQPVVDLQTGFNNYDIHFGNHTFQLSIIMGL